MSTVIKVENLGKQYRLGEVGTGTLSHDLNRWWAKVRGNEDPFAKIGESNDRTAKGQSDYVWALRNINFEVQAGEVLGIIGRNGAGKSTLLKILSKVTKPSSGRILTKGRIASLLEVGTGFHPEMTGRDNVFLNGAIMGMTRNEIKKKFDEIVDFSGVERYIDTPVKRYSSGMYVRLAFAVAAHLESEILIVDEVLAVGDAEFQKKCLGKMGDVSKREGRTVLFVSHNLSAVGELCTQGVVVEKGKIVIDGSVKSALNYYAENHLEGLKKDLMDKKNHPRPMDFSFIKDIHIADSNTRKEKATFRMGDDIWIKLKVEIKKFMPNAEIGIKIGSIHGTNLSYFVSTWEGITGDLEKGEYEFTIIIPNINFLPGKYFISPWSVINGQKSDDLVQDAVLIEIIKNDLGTTQAYYERYATSGCEIYLPSSWNKLKI